MEQGTFCFGRVFQGVSTTTSLPAHTVVTMPSNAPLGVAAIGAEVARDFGEENGGVFGGIVQSFDEKGGRLYRVKYSDGDAEDFDEDEYTYAWELANVEKSVLLAEDNGDESEAGSGASSSSEGSDDAAHSGKRVSQQSQDAGPFKPNWVDVRSPSQGQNKRLKFKPVFPREAIFNEGKNPKFFAPCRETGDISPDSFTRLFLPDELVCKTARNSGLYRKTKAVSGCYFTWLPFLLYILNVIRINSYTCHRKLGGKDSHADFTLGIVQALFDRRLDQLQTRKRQAEEAASSAPLPAPGVQALAQMC